MSSQIRPDIAETIRKAFPDDVMALVMDIQESYLADVFPRLKTKLLEIDAASVLHERDPTGGPGWAAGDGRLPPDPAPVAPIDRPKSYYLFFLSPDDSRFRPGDGDGDDLFQAIGWSVALSVLAPFAMFTLTCMERDSVTESNPDIVPEDMEDPESGKAIDVKTYCEKYLGEDGKRILDSLHREITAVLESFDLTVVPGEELDKVVPWLKLPGISGPQPQMPWRQIAVRDAFFFWGM